MADAVISLPSYLTSMFVQQRLTQQGWAMKWLFLPGLLAGAAGMAGASLGRRLHPKQLRALYFGCALLVATGTLLAGAAPALLCAAGPVLVQGHSPSGSCTVCSGSTTRSPVTAAQRSSAWTAWPTVC